MLRIAADLSPDRRSQPDRHLAELPPVLRGARRRPARDDAGRPRACTCAPATRSGGRWPAAGRRCSRSCSRSAPPRERSSASSWGCCSRASWPTPAGSSGCRSRSRARRSSSRRSSSGSTSTAGIGSRRARTGCRAFRSRSPRSASAFFIVTANAWMNVPRGFQIVHGRVTHVDPLAAMFNPAWATETSHMVLGCLSGDGVRRRERVRDRDAARPPEQLPPQGDRAGDVDGRDHRPAAAGRRRPARSHRRRPSARDAGGDRGRHATPSEAPA